MTTTPTPVPTAKLTRQEDELIAEFTRKWILPRLIRWLAVQPEMTHVTHEAETTEESLPDNYE